MEKQYLDKYVSHFNLHKSGNKFLNEHYEHVLSIIDGKVFYRININEWKTCKSGDLIVSVINNIPLHG